MTHQPRVVMCSMWKDDSARQLVDRVEHLLAKCESYPALRWLFVVGDSSDDTAQTLGKLTNGYDNVTIVDIGSTGIEGNDATSRLRRLSETANEYFHWVDGADYILIHESDQVTPYDLVPRMVANAERGICPVAAWAIINLHGQRLCYDIWALRKDGVRFTNHAPYHACYRADKPFVVDSFGTVFMFHAEDASLIHMQDRAVLDLCDQLRQQGRTLWVDPAIVTEQPVELWTFQNIREHA